MAELHLPLSLGYTEFTDQRLAGGGYAGTGDCSVLPIAADVRAKAQERLEAELIYGLEGEPLDWTPELARQVRCAAGLLS